MDFEAFELDREWLATQPGMDSWDRGRGNLLTKLDAWLDEYTLETCEPGHARSESERVGCVNRLWLCWKHHWKQAVDSVGGPIDGLEVASRVSDGRGYSKGGKLGGNPFRDIVLADAIARHNNRATEIFLKEFRDFLIGLAGTVDYKFSSDPDWWDEFMDLLAGYTLSKPAKLDSFTGRCGLQNWLGTVVKNHARNLCTRKTNSTYSSTERSDEKPYGGGMDSKNSTPDTAMLTNECEQLLQKRISDSINSLEESQRLVLLFRFEQNMSGKEIAGVLQIHQGNVARRIKGGLESLRAELSLDAPTRDESYGECVEQLMLGNEGRSLAEFLVTSLKEFDSGATV